MKIHGLLIPFLMLLLTSCCSDSPQNLDANDEPSSNTSRTPWNKPQDLPRVRYEGDKHKIRYDQFPQSPEYPGNPAPEDVGALK